MLKSNNNDSHTVIIKLSSGESLGILVGPEDTVITLKQRVSDHKKVPPKKQNLLIISKSLQLDNRRALSHYNLQTGSMTHMTDERLTSATTSTTPSNTITHHDDLSEKISGPSNTPSNTISRLSASPASASTANNAALEANITKLRQSAIRSFAKIITTLKPHKDAKQNFFISQWPLNSQVYCIYTRKPSAESKEITGIITHGLSNPYQENTVGAGIEILVEAPTTQTQLREPDGKITGASASNSWMFKLVQRIAHSCFALGLQIQQLLKKSQALSIEITSVGLPPEYVDPSTGLCHILLGHLGDPKVSRGFYSVTTPHQNQCTVKHVSFIPARLLTLEQHLAIKANGGKVRKIADEFIENKEYSVCYKPTNLGLITAEATPQASPSKAVGSITSSASSSKAVGGIPFSTLSSRAAEDKTASAFPQPTIKEVAKNHPLLTAKLVTAKAVLITEAKKTEAITSPTFFSKTVGTNTARISYSKAAGAATASASSSKTVRTSTLASSP